jgi:hypothetical protein
MEGRLCGCGEDATLIVRSLPTPAFRASTPETPCDRFGVAFENCLHVLGARRTIVIVASRRRDSAPKASEEWRSPLFG